MTDDLDAVLEDAEELSFARPDPEPGQPRMVDGQGKIYAGRWAQAGFVSHNGLPPDCPVIPLGADGGKFYFLNTLGQIVNLAELKAERVKGLFAGRLNYLYWMAPRWQSTLDKKTVTELNNVIEEYGMDHEQGRAAFEMLNSSFKCDGWDANIVADLLYDACANKGVWRDFELVRGRGAWENESGGLIYHCGDVLVALDPKKKGELLKAPPGDYGEAVYPAGARATRPWSRKAGPEAARDLLDILNTWRWQRGDLDARLLLGWILVAMVNGALDWRPAAYVNGSRGTGKSSLIKLIRKLLGASAIWATNATAASIYQRLSFDASPVLLDEFEPLANAAKTRAIVELMRDAVSGGVVMRGGADHKGTSFTAKSPFLFASILTPGLRPQDRSRLVLLNLRKFREEDREPDIDMAEIGGVTARKLMRRMLDRWADFKPTLYRFHEALRAVGHDSRGADQFGVLLTLAQLALHDGQPSDEDIARLAARVEPQTLHEIAGQEEEWERCLTQLVTTRVEAQDWRTKGVHTLGQLLDDFVNVERVDPDFETRGIFNTQGGDVMAPGPRLEKVNGFLSAVGLKIQGRIPERPDIPWWLAVPLSDEQLRQMFRGTDYEGEAGVEGVWTNSLRSAEQLEFDVPEHPGVWFAKKARINGRQRWCTWLRLDAVVSAIEDAEDDTETPASGAPAGEGGYNEFPDF